ncbi:MAG TPA: lamin tail domain-containing protein [Candidatus Paceibacterota bacterium]|nr:lamin tail domain-containing protein [Candidatus Paceibacterota bacterium]
MLTRILAVAAIALPLAASAEVTFTEVMYDLETGSDSGREWVEIRNDGSASVDVSGYRFREGDSNHTLTLSQGNAVLPPGGVAVIADNPSKFLADHPSFSGTLFDSSFSLSNAGETLTLKDGALIDIDQFTYSSDMGAAGDGKSLQKTGSAWAAAAPTPGSVAGAGTAPPSEEPPSSEGTASSSESSVSAPPAPSGSSSKWPVAPQIHAHAGEDRQVTAGTPAEFRGEALGIDKKPLQNARYLWNFGDGAFGEGKNVLHSYRYPGSYLATLDVSSGEFSNSDKLVVTVLPADLALRSGVDSLGGFLEIENRGAEEANLSYWQLLSGGRSYILPKDTFLLGKKSVRFPESVTLLSYAPSAELRYPNGTLALRSGAVPIAAAPSSVAAPLAVPVVSTPRSEESAPHAIPTRISVPERQPAAVAAVPASLPTAAVASSHLGEYKWFYLLAALLSAAIFGVLWLGRFAGGDIEIVEDSS